jgi:hypothetical protein
MHTSNISQCEGFSKSGHPKTGFWSFSLAKTTNTLDDDSGKVDLLRIHVLGREYDALRSGERFFAEGKVRWGTGGTGGTVFCPVTKKEALLVRIQVTTVAASISQMNTKPGSMVMP